MKQHDPLDRPYNLSLALPAIDAIRTPWLVRFLGRLLLLIVILTPFILIFVPWQQTVRGRGEVIAFVPGQREQAVTSPIAGQISRWYVNETDYVKTGDKIVEVIDNDPDYDARLKRQRDLLKEQANQVGQQAEELEKVVQEQIQARNSALAAARAVLEAQQQGVEKTNAQIEANKAMVKFNRESYQRLHALSKEGLESKLNVFEAEAEYKSSVAKGEALVQELKQAKAHVLKARAAIDQVQADRDAAVASAKAVLRKAKQQLPALESQVQQLNVQIRRYGARLVLAPTNGTVFRIMPQASQAGQFVQAGQVVSQIVPDADLRVVELYIDGRDAPLITRDEKTGLYPQARLQFEGWPAVQFTSGWPEASVGTFGGRVFRIDPTDDGTGRFRILVKPDPFYEGDEWPDPRYLRQGNQVIGWIFLDRVPLGWELWRRMNGFPPVEPPRAAQEKKFDKIKVKPK